MISLPLPRRSPSPVREAPPLSLLFAETRVARDWAMARMRPRAHPRAGIGQGAPVLTLPGFLAGDLSMKQMRANLLEADFRAEGWDMGVNLGARADTIARIADRVDAMAARAGRPVHLVGWSLGGVFAREFAKHHPEAVASVTTMGSPFSGSRRANNAWQLYQLVARHPIDAPPVDFHPAPRPPVPTYALWSPNDGVVSPGSARGTRHERDRAIELDCGHMGFAYAPAAVDAVIDCMVEAEKVRTGR